MFIRLFISFCFLLVLGITGFFGVQIQAQKLPEQKLKIELGQHFQNDRVKIYLNKKLVYNQKLTTQDSSRTTDVFEVKKPAGNFTVTVEINDSRYEKSSPKQPEELDNEDYSLHIDFNRQTEEVEIKRKVVIVLYD